VAHTRPSQAKAEYDAGTRRDDPRLAEAARIRSSSRWQRFRNWFKARHPLCCDPFGEHGDTPVPVAQVHHVASLAERPELACDEGNCRSLCTRCHARVERMERDGQSSRALFVLPATEGAR
jgi:5-methylcytosine-specific restriction endonuclease McrA